MDTILREPTTVGEMLSEEFLKPLNITQVKLGEALNLSRPRIAEIINGKRRISIEEAVMLAALFETDADFWINVQASHDRWEARQLMAQKMSTQPIKALLAR
ncbi:HigA family addiction module antidote protein [Xenorhabdus sp. 42]|uniref:HigA family addiction module antitoxin n=1 Tax=Xenorhabdus szentirmaii TaxID=290112 RepID=UPI001997C485|nr:MULTISPECIES: HigA family addiction module antitoxin [unclassified Xenorhabdus]MBD2780843.1 HigA family addiction module antidote protein [Xenorhabdus sp. 38]MBD2820715.1 HigA family addiction module antidote protein [Xenorhabdus sp. 42]